MFGVVLTVLLSMPGYPAKTYTHTMRDMKSCEIAAATVHVEVDRIAGSKGITRNKGDLQTSCTDGMLVSYP